MMNKIKRLKCDRKKLMNFCALGEAWLPFNRIRIACSIIISESGNKIEIPSLKTR